MGYKMSVGVSNKHLHLAEADIEVLFGVGHKLQEFKPLSQPGQFAAMEKVDVVGPKGTLKGLRVLGPARKETQVELAFTDARAIGINVPVNESGSLDGSPGATLIGPAGEVVLSKGVIAALRHIHMSDVQAKEAGVVDKQFVSLKFEGARGLVFDKVLIRANPEYLGEIHIDTDEGNAGGIVTGDIGEIIV